MHTSQRPVSRARRRGSIHLGGWAAFLCLLGGQIPAAADPAVPGFTAAPASPATVFSAHPDTGEIRAARVFEEPLVPTTADSPPRAAENGMLAAALGHFQQACLAAGPSTDAGDLEAFEAFLTAYPQSR